MSFVGFMLSLANNFTKFGRYPLLITNAMYILYINCQLLLQEERSPRPLQDQLLTAVSGIVGVDCENHFLGKMLNF